MKAKHIILSISLLFLILNSQSCSWLIKKTQGDYCKQWGYITDTNGVGIPDVKITVLMAESHLVTPIETNRIFYTDQEGFYDIYIDNSDSVYYMKMTHDEYIYPIPQPQIGYPQIAYANIQLEDELYNFEMVKKGKVKIEGDVRYLRPDLTYYWMPDVKISVLKRKNGDTNYPDTTGDVAYTDENGLFYIEFEGDENYEFFLKPEKDGYFYSNLYHEGTILEDCASCTNLDPGYIIEFGFKMLKEEE